MKRAAYIFILLFCFGFKLFSAKSECVFALKQLSGISKTRSNSKEIAPASIINSKNYPSSNKILSEKKIRQRGTVSICYLFTNNSPLLVDLSSKKLIPASQTFYIPSLFFCNEKRGPPSV